jgi:hypothetical protein
MAPVPEVVVVIDRKHIFNNLNDPVRRRRNTTQEDDAEVFSTQFGTYPAPPPPTTSIARYLGWRA